MKLPLWRRRQKAELEEELCAHLEQAMRERMERGQSREQAEAAARREFGNPDLVQEVTRDTWGWMSFDELAQDLRYALRTMASRPTFAAVVILLLALGIGANTAIFGLWYGLLYAPLPGVERPEELVVLSNPDDSGSWTGRWDGRTDGPRSWLSYEEFEDLRDHADRFASLMAAQSTLSTWPVRFGGDEGQEAHGRLVSGGYFQVLGVRPAIGRLFEPQEDRIEAPYAVISYAYWQRRFGGRRDVLGKTLQVQRAALTVIGVTPPGFIGETVGQQPDLWLPLRMQLQVLPGRDMLHDTPPEKVMWLQVFGRLQPGVTDAQAEAQANAIFRAGLESFYGAARIARRQEFMDQRLQIRSGERGASGKRGALSGSLTALLAAVGVLLLIVCTNLANLLLARGVARRPEIALRLSLGASRGRLIRQLATESLTLAVLGAVAAVAVANVLHAALVQMLAASDSRFQMSFRLDSMAALFLVTATCAATCLFGVLPGWQVARADAGEYLKELSRRTVGGKGQMRSGQFLVSLQLALSLPLLVGAGLLVRTVYNLQHADLAFAPQGLTLVRFDLRAAGYEPARRASALRLLLEEIRRIPGVQRASFSQLGIFSGGESSETIEVEDYIPRGENDRDSGRDVVGPDYFSTLGVPVRLGREIQDGDVGGSRVCVINAAFAKQFFDGRNPIGMHITEVGDGGQRKGYEVVGVAQDARTQALRGEIRPRYFVSALQDLDAVKSPTLVIRAGSAPGTLIAGARAAIRRVDAALPILSSESLTERIGQLAAVDRAITQLVAVFGCFALALAGIGLYGVLSYGVARRTGEMAIRIALGAQPVRVITMILRETTGLVLAGLVAGGGLAYAGTRLLESRLYGIAPEDPLTLILATGLLLAVALTAAFVPARRAARVDPAVALRHE